ncbi:hypothetical protein X747_32670 [Mesorhizobium sp. LNJC384A00]|nr:hypothetical protein X747_32670 [Mesorhizobium sp. LNJC384A00]ESY29438.1 hypothetical protein X749_15955 [Mesorhizobium sp. LNJC391B00]
MAEGFSLGQVGRLIDIVARLSEFDEYDTIYASEPWTEDSDAMVATGLDTEDRHRRPSKPVWNIFLRYISVEKSSRVGLPQ